VPPIGFSRSARYLYVGAILALILTGFLARGWGVVPVPLDFWADEAWWATLLGSGEFAQFSFRPVGYMWLSRGLLELGNPELWLRVPSLLAACAALYCLYRSAELSTRTRVAALFVTLIAAFHPKLVIFAKEFKPYAVEVFVFSALTYWTLHCLRLGRGRARLFAAALLFLPFCYPVVFLYPGIALALAGERVAVLRRVSARQWVYATLVVVPLLAVAHFYLFETLDSGPNRVQWGDKYDVFPLDTGFLGGIAWYASKTWSLITLPGALEAMPAFGRTLFGAGFAGGMAVLAAGRRYRELALFISPIVMCAAANFLGYWPYGEFRANLFLIPGTLLLTAQAVDWLAVDKRGRWLAYGTLVAAACVTLAAGIESFRTKLSMHWAAAPQMTDVLAEIDRRRAGEPGWSDVILADWHSWRPILYYLPRKASLRDQARLVRGPVGNLAALESQLAEEIARASRELRPTRLWLVVTRLDAHDAIRDSVLVTRYSVHQREFSTGDRPYHPLLIELHIDVRPDLLPAAAQRYHPRPRVFRAS
jgi:hypothetical protein